jgi:hypothetical protein
MQSLRLGEQVVGVDTQVPPAQVVQHDAFGQLPSVALVDGPVSLLVSALQVDAAVLVPLVAGVSAGACPDPTGRSEPEVLLNPLGEFVDLAEGVSHMPLGVEGRFAAAARARQHGPTLTHVRTP